MDVRSNRFLVAAYAVFIVIVGLVAYVGYSAYVNSAGAVTQQQLLQQDQAARESSLRRPTRSASGRRRPIPASEDNGSLQRLRELLAKRNEILQHQRAQLEHTTETNQQLREEVERLSMLAELVGDVPVGASGNGTATVDNLQDEAEAPPSQPSADDLDAVVMELAQAQTELLEAENWIVQLEDAILREVDRANEANDALQSAEQWIAELETAAVREMEKSEAVSNALLSLGSDAVPALVEILEEGKPTQQRWAATLLGRLRGDAADAIDSLENAARSSNADLKNAATEALRQINAARR